MHLRRFSLLACFALAACSRRSGDDKGIVGHGGSEKDPVSYVRGSDPAMTAAIAKAQATLGVFEGALAAPPPGAEGFSIKVGFPYGQNSREHIWLTDVKLTATDVTGTINNDPVDVKNLKLGQVVTSPRADVSDWMYVEGGLLRGGYTLRVLLDKMSPEERQKTLAEMGGLRLE